jgi:regulator of sirC expression with transglutaminase-like and TPR domain
MLTKVSALRCTLPYKHPLYVNNQGPLHFSIVKITYPQYQLGMFLNTNITWDKLKIELELLKTSPPTSLIPLLYGVDTLVFHRPSLENSLQILKQMSFELKKRTENLSCEEKINTLNEYFFQEVGFQPHLNETDSSSLESWQPQVVIESKEGASILISLIYQHLAFEIDIALQLVSHPHFVILKWVRPGKTSQFLDLSRDGQFISDKELTSCFNKFANTNKTAGQKNIFEYLNNSKTLNHYLKGIYSHIDEISETNDVLTLLNIMVLHFPEGAHYILKRALLHKSLGRLDSAQMDFKVYLSLVHEKHLDPEIKSIYFDLQSQLKFIKAKPSKFTDLTLLH